MKNKYKEILAKNLIVLMKHHNDSMASLGKKAKVDPKTIGHCIRVDSRVSPTIEKITEIASVYRVDIWKLFIDGAEVDFLLSKESFMSVSDGDNGKLPPRVKNAINFLTSPPNGLSEIARDLINIANTMIDFRKASLHNASKQDNQVKNRK